MAGETDGITIKSTQITDLAAMQAATVAGLVQLVAAPALATSPGTPGQVAYDATHFYVCVALNTWVRATFATF
jgi:hypothetical protein